MEENESQRVLSYFDLLWFEHQILHQAPPAPYRLEAEGVKSTSPNPTPLLDGEDVESHSSEPPPDSLRPVLFQRRHHRSLSDESLASGDTVPPLVIRPHKLQTVFSGKAAPEEQAGVFLSGKGSLAVEDSRRLWRWRRWDRRRRMRKAVERKSLTDLEFKELKGFADLGFTFSEEEMDPRLMEIVPGLQRRLRRKNSGGDAEAPAEAAGEASEGYDPNQRLVARPYLSEAWDAAEEAEGEDMLLRGLRIPAAGSDGGGGDLKDQLRFWAHAVASTVR